MTGQQTAHQESAECEAVLRRAAEWHAASTQTDMDWEGFTLWLEADPRHRDAYDQIAQADAALSDHGPAILAMLEELADDGGEAAAAPRRVAGRGLWAGVAIAASLVAVLVLPRFFQAPSRSYETQATAERIALRDGSTILLAPGSRLTISGERQETIALAGGAWFDIRHDPARQLTITAGGASISDIGTRFDVQTQDRRLRVGVADGIVRVSGPSLGAPVQLAEGRGLLLNEANGTAVVRDLAPGSIGQWRSGRLSYSGTPLSLVVADISRYAGVEVELAPSLRDREFSGTFVIGNGQAALRDLSQLMDIELAGGSGRYRLAERNR